MFSVLIPAYNHKHYIEEAIGSALKSRLVREVLVVDDGSSDGTAEILIEIIGAFGKAVRLIENPERENLGAHQRLNQLCAEATGPWLAILNSDDQFCDGRFEIIRDTARSTKANFVSGSLLIINDNSHVIGTKRGLIDLEYPLPPALQALSLHHQLDLFTALCAQNYIATTSNMAFTKDLFKQLGGFRDLRYCHDWDFALRACLEGTVAFSPHPITKYRVHTTNTIKEPSSHADGEVIRLFSWLVDEHPWIDDDPQILAALDSNQHLSNYVRNKDIGRSDPDGTSLLSISFATGSSETVTQPLFEKIGGYLSAGMSGRRLVANVLLCLSQDEYDFVILSETLEEPPTVRIRDFHTNVLARKPPTSEPPGDAERAATRGRVIRHVPSITNGCLLTMDVRTLSQFHDCRCASPDIVVGHGQARPFTRKIARHLSLPGLPEKTGRPRCLVFPVYMAVGGVERNTVEIIRALRYKYDFLVVTSEYLLAHQNSLHHQLDDLNVLTIDLAEAANQDRHIVLLESIKDTFQPDIVYVCNGSPWLANAAKHFRKVFSKCAIVDQQVYDTEYGWIQHYGASGIQSFDRFIATNQRIFDKFRSAYRIPSNRVDLIYPCINAQRLTSGLLSRRDQLVLRQRAGFGDDQLVFAFLGRLTPQKRPIDYLEVARRAQESGWNDQFILAGEGELSDSCDKFITDHQLRNVRRIAQYNDVCELVNLIDGLIIVSEFEGLPIVLLEALSLGKPALATDVGDIALVLRQYKSGIIIDRHGDVSNWNAFIEFRSNISRLGENAMDHRMKVLDEFSSDSIADLYDRSWTQAMRQVPGHRHGKRVHGQAQAKS